LLWHEYSVEREQQLPGEIVFSVGYFKPARPNLIGSTNLAVPRSAYTPIQVTEVVSGRQVTVHNME
jgi:hypothetical protein